MSCGGELLGRFHSRRRSPTPTPPTPSVRYSQVPLFLQYCPRLLAIVRVAARNGGKTNKGILIFVCFVNYAKNYFCTVPPPLSKAVTQSPCGVNETAQKWIPLWLLSNDRSMVQTSKQFWTIVERWNGWWKNCEVNHRWGT